MATWTLERQIPVVGEYDVVVCGAGPAGFCAAVQAGRMGAKTALIDAANGPGGVITSGGNTEIALFYAHGRQIISGIGWELVTELARDGWARLPDFAADVPHSQLGVSVIGPMIAHYMDQYCRKAGVDLYYLHPITDVATRQSADGTAVVVDGVVVATKTGLQLIRGSLFIDATGDGDVAAFAGFDFELGDRLTGELQPATLRFYPIGYELADIDSDQVGEAFKAARAAGDLARGDYWPEPRGNPYGSVFKHLGNNVNHVHPINGADSRSRSAAEVRGRESLARIATWARRRVEGAAGFTPLAMGAYLGVRESRRVVGREYVTEEDYYTARRWDDAVCHAFYPIDLHTAAKSDSPTDTSLKNRFLERGVVPSIPYGALTPRRSHNLLVAGRCVSSDRMANSALRVKAPCMAMGQAAATAAVLALRQDCRVDLVDTGGLRAALAAGGAIVPD